VLDRANGPASRRTAAYRRRLRRGAIVARVEVDAAIVDLLCRLRWLAEADAGDRRAVGAAVSKLLADAAR
jgi:hypothetical protein